MCKIAGCGTPLKPKNTSGMCPKCYGRELYRRKRGLPGGSLGTIQRKAAKAAALPAPKAPKAMKRISNNLSTCSSLLLGINTF